MTPEEGEPEREWLGKAIEADGPWSAEARRRLLALMAHDLEHVFGAHPDSE